jgi:hypothetical protein
MFTVADFHFDVRWQRVAFKNEKSIYTTRISYSAFHYVQLFGMIHFLLEKTIMCAPNINFHFLKLICGLAS